MDNKTRTALISGAASGIGAAAIEKFIDQGYNYLIALDRDKQGLENLQEQFSSKPVEIITVVADVTKSDELKHLTQELAPLSQLNAVILSHGIADENDIAETDIFNRVLQVNLMSCQTILSICDEKLIKDSAVVFVSSILGKMGNHRNTGYCTSKHAQLGLMKALAMDWARRGIRVNAVLPCYVDTPMLRNELQKQADMTGDTLERVMRKAKKRIPMRNFLESMDIANAIYFFASDDSRMMTAQSLVVDGGSSCGA